MELSHLPPQAVSGEQEASAPECVGNWWKVPINSFLCRVLVPVDILHSTEEVCIISIQLFLTSLC